MLVFGVLCMGVLLNSSVSDVHRADQENKPWLDRHDEPKGPTAEQQSNQLLQLHLLRSPFYRGLRGCWFYLEAALNLWMQWAGLRAQIKIG